MIQHVSVVSVPVSDQDKALDFYVNKLGFEKRMDMPMGPDARWLTVAPPGAETSIMLSKGPENPLEPGKGGGLVFATSDCQATYETLRDRGVNFTEPPTQQDWGGIQALFTDQDSNWFVLVQMMA